MENGFYGHDDPVPINDETKIKWWLSMPFIWVMFFVTSFLFCIPAIALFVIRIVKYPSRRKTAVLSVALPFVAIIILSIVLTVIDGNKDKEIEKEIENGNFDNAIHLIDERYSSTSYKYYSSMADVYEKQDDYDSAASYLIDYIKNCDEDSMDSNVVDRLTKNEGKSLRRHESRN